MSERTPTPDAAPTLLAADALPCICEEASYEACERRKRAIPAVAKAIATYGRAERQRALEACIAIAEAHQRRVPYLDTGAIHGNAAASVIANAIRALLAEEPIDAD